MDSSFMKYFECPICNDYFEPPIYICFNGHSICNVCKKQLQPKKCPSCKAQIGNTRNYALEQMVDEIEFFCDNDDCSEQNTLQDYEEHAENCGAIIPCQAPNCILDVSVATINDHILEKHQSFIVNCKETLKTHQYAFCILKYGKHMFWIKRYTTNDDNEDLSWSAQATTYIDSDKTFQFTVRVHTPEKKFYALTQTCSTDPCEEEENLLDQAVVYLQRSDAAGSKFSYDITSD